jgi:AraC-like DNA-binding protein
MSREREEHNRRLLRARDTIDRSYATPLDVAALARVAHLSPAHFARQFRVVFGETPHRYLQRRRIERAMELLRDTDRPVTEVCLDVGFASLGTFSRTFGTVVGESPSRYRERTRSTRTSHYVPACLEKELRRPVGAPGHDTTTAG